MFKTVLVPVDVTIPDETEKTLAAAKELTAPWECDLHVVTVVPDVGMAIVGSYFDKGFDEASHEKAEQELKSAVERAGLEATRHVMTGTAYDRIIALAESLGTDLIIIRAHSPELRDYLLGSNAARIVRHSKRSVLVLRD